MNEELIADLFDKIYESDALIIKPAEDMELERCARDFNDIGITAVPDDYFEFLKMANGVAWNGFEFFGTYQITVKKTGYVLEDIVSVNQKMRNRKPGLEKMIVLGRFDDDIYVYNSEKFIYQALDSLTLIEIESYESFDELFSLNVGAYIDFDDFDDSDDVFDEIDED